VAQGKQHALFGCQRRPWSTAVAEGEIGGNGFVQCDQRGCINLRRGGESKFHFRTVFAPSGFCKQLGVQG
jgi:hypothetical protein